LYIRPIYPDPLAEHNARTILEFLHGNPGEYAIIVIDQFIENMRARNRLIHLGRAETLPPPVYLSAGMLRLSQLSLLDNIALIIGLAGLVNLLLFLYVTHERI
jgi:hypothetical protein